MTAHRDIVIELKGAKFGPEFLNCHTCRRNSLDYDVPAKAFSDSNTLDSMCPLDINETRTCNICHEQMGVWWFREIRTEKDSE